MYGFQLFFLAKYLRTRYFRTTATIVNMTQLASAVQNTVNSRANVIVSIIMFNGKLIAVPMAVSLNDSFHANLSDLFILLTIQTDPFVFVH